MPIDRKYGRVTLENQRNIGDDEPVFIFRAQDKVLPELLEEYYWKCKASGSPGNHLSAIVAAQKEIEKWQREHGSKVPDSVGYSVEEGRHE